MDASRKETQMDQFRMTTAMMAAIDSRSQPRDAQDRRRKLTIEELDALTDFSWHWPDAKGGLAACARLLRSLVRPRARTRLEPTRLPSAAAPSHG